MLKNLEAAIAALKKHPHAAGIEWTDYDRLLTQYLMELAANYFCSTAVITAVADDAELTDIRRGRRRKRRRHREYKSRSEAQKDEARSLLKSAVKRGTVQKPNQCEGCLDFVTGHLLHGHHTDYSKPYAVQWLCVDCHAEAHNGRDYLAKHEVKVTHDNQVVKIERIGRIERPCDKH